MTWNKSYIAACIATIIAGFTCGALIKLIWLSKPPVKEQAYRVTKNFIIAPEGRALSEKQMQILKKTAIALQIGLDKSIKKTKKRAAAKKRFAAIQKKWRDPGMTPRSRIESLKKHHADFGDVWLESQKDWLFTESKREDLSKQTVIYQATST